MENCEKVLNILKSRLLNSPNGGACCPICGFEHFTFMRQGYNILPLTNSVKDPRPNGHFIPTCFMVCDNCGFISQHIEKVLIDPPSRTQK
jgi:hypothetical protein